MYQYQLRIPFPMWPADLIQEIAVNSWAVLNKHLQTEGVYCLYRREIQKAFSPYLKAFALCGSSNICDDEMRPLSSDACNCIDARIFHLQLPLTLDLFLEHFASDVLRKTCPSLKLEKRNQTRADLRLAIHSTLNQYLHTNPWCGKAQMCEYSKPIDPWSESERKKSATASD